jgi:hypothetical protein
MDYNIRQMHSVHLKPQQNLDGRECTWGTTTHANKSTTKRTGTVPCSSPALLPSSADAAAAAAAAAAQQCAASCSCCRRCDATWCVRQGNSRVPVQVKGECMQTGQCGDQSLPSNRAAAHTHSPAAWCWCAAAPAACWQPQCDSRCTALRIPAAVRVSLEAQPQFAPSSSGLQSCPPTDVDVRRVVARCVERSISSP